MMHEILSITNGPESTHDHYAYSQALWPTSAKQAHEASMILHCRDVLVSQQYDHDVGTTPDYRFDYRLLMAKSTTEDEMTFRELVQHLMFLSHALTT